MTHRLNIPRNIAKSSFLKALNERGNFFTNLRLIFTKELESAFYAQGLNINTGASLANANLAKNATIIEKGVVTKITGFRKNIEITIDAQFCAKYGHDDYSFEALNYIDREYRGRPSLLPFIEVKNFFLGNILVLVENGDYRLTIEAEKGIDIIGYTFDIAATKRKSYVCLLGVHFEHEFLSSFLGEYCHSCTHPPESLDEVRINNAFFPVTYICRRCGTILTCTCFDEFLDIQNGLTVRHVQIEVKRNICHLCTGNIPTTQYLSTPTPSSFLIRYMPYHHLLALRQYRKFVFSQDKEYKNIENQVRDLFGYPKIGEQWFTETMLYKIVQLLFPSIEVLQHYRGSELNGLEIDIWIPDLKVGLEYQGIQHYEVIEHWGGKEGLIKRKENDKTKKHLCKALGYKLIEFRYNEVVTEELVTKRLKCNGIFPLI